MDVAHGEEGQERRGDWIPDRRLRLSGLHVGAKERESGPTPLPLAIVVWCVFGDLARQERLRAMRQRNDHLVECGVDVCGDRVGRHFVPVRRIPDHRGAWSGSERLLQGRENRNLEPKGCGANGIFQEVSSQNVHGEPLLTGHCGSSTKEDPGLPAPLDGPRDQEPPMSINGQQASAEPRVDRAQRAGKKGLRGIQQQVPFPDPSVG